MRSLFAILLVRPQQLPTTLALVPGELSSSLEDVVERCVRQQAELAGRLTRNSLPAITAGQVAAAGESHRQAFAMFLNDQGYFVCTLDQIVRPILGVRIQAGGGATGDVWAGTRDWLPGPVQVLMSGSAVPSDGPARMTIVGRAGSRVARLVAEDGTHTVGARLANGVFGLLADSGQVASDGGLVAYDAAGEVVFQRSLFPTTFLDDCYADPAGTVLYHADDEQGPARRCLPAEPWGH